MKQSKVRPLRVFRDKDGYYTFFGKKKQYIDVEASTSYKDAQKKTMNKLKGSIEPKSIIRESERPRFSSNDGLLRKQLINMSEIKPYKDTDEGYKSKLSLEEQKLKNVEEKISRDLPLSAEEEKTARLYIPPKIIVKAEQKIADEKKADSLEDKKQAELVAEQKSRFVLIEKMFKRLGYDYDDFTAVNSWNGLNNGDAYFYLHLNTFLNYIKSMSRSEIFRYLGGGDRGGGYFFLSRNDSRPEMIKKLLRRLTPIAYYHLTRADPYMRDQLIGADDLTFDVANQLGTGKKLPALYNDEIEDFFDEKTYPNFGGVIAADQISQLPKKLPIGFVMNLDNSDEPGSHWVAIYINSDSVEYFDSLGQQPPDQVRKDIKKYLLSMNVPILMKFKTNSISQQHGSSHKCGYHAIRFLDERMKYNTPYKFATHFAESSTDGDKKIKEEFSYI